MIEFLIGWRTLKKIQNNFKINTNLFALKELKVNFIQTNSQYEYIKIWHDSNLRIKKLKIFNVK